MLYYKSGKKLKTCSQVTFYSNPQSDGEEQALLVLLGGYNEFGRNLDLAKYRELVRQFKDILDQIAIGM